MTDEACAERVALALLAVPGVSAVRVNHAEGRAVVTADTGQAAESNLRAAVAGAGCRPLEVLAVE